jgi:hypothetical protein
MRKGPQYYIDRFRLWELGEREMADLKEGIRRMESKEFTTIPTSSIAFKFEMQREGCLMMLFLDEIRPKLAEMNARHVPDEIQKRKIFSEHRDELKRRDRLDELIDGTSNCHNPRNKARQLKYPLHPKK